MSDLNHLYSERSDARSKQQTLENKLDRLYAAKDKLSAARDEANALKKDVSKQTDYKATWSGQKYTQYLKDNNYLVEEYADYINRINDAIDAIKDEIHRTDGQLQDTVGLLRWIGGKIENLFE